MNYGDRLELLEAKNNQGKLVDVPLIYKLRRNGFVDFLLKQTILTASRNLMVSGYFVVGKYSDIRSYSNIPAQFVNKVICPVTELFIRYKIIWLAATFDLHKDFYLAGLNSTSAGDGGGSSISG